MLDGQAVSDSDRSAAAEYGARQAQLQQALELTADNSTSSGLASSVSGLPGLAGTDRGSRSGLPGVPQRGSTSSTAKNTRLKQQKSRELPASISLQQQHSGDGKQLHDTAGVPGANTKSPSALVPHAPVHIPNKVYLIQPCCLQCCITLALSVDGAPRLVR